jgi:uncharacterized protein YciI
MSDTTEFLVYSRAAPGADEPDPGLTEAHWAYMDQFADGMIARGPTLAPDRETWTGSVHILALPGADAAREFVEREPYNRSGLFETHLIRRFNRLLDRTMWDFPSRSDDPRFIVIAQAPADAGDHTATLDPTAVTPEQVIVHGELLTADHGRPAGIVVALQAPTRPSTDALFTTDRPRLGVEIHDWEFGGRR